MVLLPVRITRVVRDPNTRTSVAFRYLLEHELVITGSRVLQKIDLISIKSYEEPQHQQREEIFDTMKLSRFYLQRSADSPSEPSMSSVMTSTRLIYRLLSALKNLHMFL